MAFRIGRPPGICGAITGSSSPLRRSKIGWKELGKKRSAELAHEYEPWALEKFSGYLAADEIYDGPFCVLFAVDSKRQRRLAYEVLDHNPTQEDILRFFRRIHQMLTARVLLVFGITTDGSPLYPEPLRDIFPQAAHQVCEFHVLKEITRDILRALAKVRKQLVQKIPKLPRGRPATLRQKSLSRKAQRLRDQITLLFENRYLLVQHGLSPSDQQTFRIMARLHRDIRPLRRLMDEVYRLFDRRCRTETAQAKLAKLRGKLSRFEHLGKVLSKIQAPNIEKALTFLDDKMLEATSNSVERANRRHRKMQKSIYRVRTQESLTSRIALDMFRDRDLGIHTAMLAQLHTARALPIGAMGI